MSKTDSKAAKEMTEAMEATMQRLQGRFRLIVPLLAELSFTLPLDEMGTRIEGLEKNVSELMTQAGMEEQAVSNEKKGASWGSAASNRPLFLSPWKLGQLHSSHGSEMCVFSCD
ncbi:hypothetical protein FQN60_007685, partial [Etheostoma spectabile]